MLWKKNSSYITIKVLQDVKIMDNFMARILLLKKLIANKANS